MVKISKTSEDKCEREKKISFTALVDGSRFFFGLFVCFVFVLGSDDIAILLGRKLGMSNEGWPR